MARREGLGNPRVSAVAAMCHDEARDPRNTVDPASIRPGEQVVLPTGEPSKQCFGRLLARVQRRKGFIEHDFVSLLDPGAEASMMSNTEATNLSEGAICMLEKGDHTVIELGRQSGEGDDSGSGTPHPKIW